MRSRYNKGQGEERWSLLHNLTTKEEYKIFTERAQQEFPAWAEDIELFRAVTVELTSTIQGLLTNAENCSVALECDFHPKFILHFSSGIALIDPGIELTPQLVDLLHAAKIVLGDRLSMGRPAWACHE